MIDIDLLISWGAAYKKVRVNQIIFSEGQPCFFYNQLVSGKVKWVNVDNEGKECIHSIFEPGDAFGDLPLFDDAPYAATAIAMEDSILIRLHKHSFLDLIKKNSHIHLAFTKLLTQKLRFKLAIIRSFASNCPELRISTILSQLKHENKHFCKDCNKLNLTRQQLADMSGLRVETVIRTIRNMHEKGELVIEKGKVYFNDMF